MIEKNPTAFNVVTDLSDYSTRIQAAITTLVSLLEECDRKQKDDLALAAIIVLRDLKREFEETSKTVADAAGIKTA